VDTYSIDNSILDSNYIIFPSQKHNEEKPIDKLLEKRINTTFTKYDKDKKTHHEIT
jgi:hypothetical protein